MQFYLCERCKDLLSLRDKPDLLQILEDALGPGGPSCSGSTAAEETCDTDGLAVPENPSQCYTQQPLAKRPKVSDLEAVEAEDHPHSSSVREPCYTCVGLLDSRFIQEVVEATHARLGLAGYRDLDSFQLSVSAPLSLSVRRKAVQLHIAKLLGDDSEFPAEGFVKEEFKLLLKIQLPGKLSIPYDNQSKFEVSVKLTNDSCFGYCSFLTKIYPECFKQGHKKGRRSSCVLNQSSLALALEKSTLSDFKSHNMCNTQCVFDVSFLHKPLYLAGRYNKFSRKLSQTPWVVDGVKKTEHSIQELICSKLQDEVMPTEIKFSASGREDADVRMLGNGRPFLIEFQNPKRVELTTKEISVMQESINSSTDMVKVRGLTVISSTLTRALKEGEEDKQKHYAALIYTSKPISNEDLLFLSEIKDLTVKQKTPLRVLHRRTLACRERIVHSLSASLIDAHHFKLELQTQAGTYIKEFVHGDFGRTSPNLRELMNQEVDIIWLDVMQVVLEWPPQTNE